MMHLFYLSIVIILSTLLSMQKSFQELLRKQNGDRAIWEYPFAVAGVNITFMLIQMLDLQAGSVSKSVMSLSNIVVLFTRLY